VLGRVVLLATKMVRDFGGAVDTAATPAVPGKKTTP
jgi:hypothetical protein